MISQLLKHSIRKDIIKGNKKVNHKSFVRSMNLSSKIPYLMKYHKKKIIFSMLVGIIIYTYDLQIPIYRKIMTMKSPQAFIKGYFIKSLQEEPTIQEQNTKGISLQDKTINYLSSMYYDFDKELFFGVGRNYLFEVYSELNTIKTDQEKRKFWSATGFFKERNQKASGVGCIQFLMMFEEALTYTRKTNPSKREEEFLWEFTEKFVSKIDEIKKWQLQFNKERFKEFIKNQFSDNTKKQDAVIELMRENPRLQLLEIDEKIKRLGLRGLNLQDQFLFWQIKRVWTSLKVYNIHKKIVHPLTSESQKIELEKEKNIQTELVRQIENRVEKIQNQYKLTYNQDLLVEEQK